MRTVSGLLYGRLRKNLQKLDSSSSLSSGLDDAISKGENLQKPNYKRERERRKTEERMLENLAGITLRYEMWWTRWDALRVYATAFDALVRNGWGEA